MLESLSTGADEAGTESTSLATEEGQFFWFSFLNFAGSAFIVTQGASKYSSTFARTLYKSVQSSSLL